MIKRGHKSTSCGNELLISGYSIYIFPVFYVQGSIIEDNIHKKIYKILLITKITRL